MAKTKKLLLTVTLAVVCLTALLCVALLPMTAAHAAGYSYKKSTATSFTASETPVVLVGQYNGKYYAMNATSSTAVGSKEVTIDGDQITSDVTDDMLWIVATSSFYRTFKNVGRNAYLNNSTYGVSLGTTAKTYYNSLELMSTDPDDYYVYINSTSVGASKSTSTRYDVYVQSQASATLRNISFAKGNEAATGTMADVKWDTETGDYTLPECGFTYPLYKFAGWKVNGEGETLAAGATVSISADTELVAQWEENWWNVTLKADGQTDSVQKVEKGGRLDLKNSEHWWTGSTPAGKMFSHWTSDGTDKLTGNYTPSADVTLTAVYSDAVTVSFNFNGGKAPTGGSSFSNTSVVKGGEFTLYIVRSSYWAALGYNPTKEGYFLMGWQVGEGAAAVKYLATVSDDGYPDGESFADQKTTLVLDEDTTVVAIWGKREYNINFVVNGSTTTKTVKNGSSFDMSLFGTGKPYQTGKIFAGWLNADNELVDVDEQITPTDDMTFTASFRDPETYTVTFHFEGEAKTKDFVENTRSNVTNQSVFNELFGSADRRLTCEGWYKDEALTEVVVIDVVNVPATFKDLHLYAKVSEEFTITFDYGVKANPNDESNKTTERYGVLGAEVLVPYPSTDSGIPENEGYTLVGWSTSAGSDVIAYKAENGVKIKIANSCTLYAVWDYNYYVVTIKLAGASENLGTALVQKIRTVGSSTKVKIADLRDAEGNPVTGWSSINVAHKDVTWTLVLEDDSRDYSVNEDITLTNDITLRVSLIDHIYTITLNWIGGKLGEIKQAYNTDVTVPETDKAGYAFVGFYLTNEAGGEYTFGKMPGEDIVVWCKYEALDSTLTFDTAGGTEIEAVTAKTGSKVNKPADPTREGYTFVAWQINGKDVNWQVDDGTATDPTSYILMPGGNNTMVAKWQITAEGLAALKTAKLAELEAYAEEKGVNVPENTIETATNEADVLAAFAAAKAKVDELKAEKDAQAKALADAKTAAKGEIAAKAAEAGITAPSTESIDKATTVEQVNAAKAAALATIEKVAAVQAKINALSGKKGTELFAAIVDATEAKDALTADEKAQLDMSGYTAAKTAYEAYVTAVNEDLNVASDMAASVAAVKLVSAVAAIAALAFVLKRRAL